MDPAQGRSLPGDQRIPALDTALAATGAENDEARIQALLDTLYDGTRLHELDVRQELFTATVGDLRELGDTFLDLAFELRGLAEQLEDRDEEHAGARLRLRPRLIAAQRAMLDGRLAPDANGTLRVGFGVVEGYRPRDGVEYQPQTTVRGVLEKDTGERPFDSPHRLLEMARAGHFGSYVDPDLRMLPVGFLSTVNVTNGSSGSSALNARGEVIGLAFDMNWEGVAADWVVNEDVVRTIQVDSRYMLWVMDAVDGAHRILEEMGITSAVPTGLPVDDESGVPLPRLASASRLSGRASVARDRGEPTVVDEGGTKSTKVGPQSRPRRSERAHWRELDDHVVILNLDSSVYSTLNPVGSLIWNAADGRRTVDEIVAAVMDAFDVDEDTARRDTVNFAETMLAEGLFEI